MMKALRRDSSNAITPAAARALALVETGGPWTLTRRRGRCWPRRRARGQQHRLPHHPNSHGPVCLIYNYPALVAAPGRSVASRSHGTPWCSSAKPRRSSRKTRNRATCSERSSRLGGGRDLSGAEIAATAFANLLTDRGLRPIGSGLQIAALVCIGLTTGRGFSIVAGAIRDLATEAAWCSVLGIGPFHQFTTHARLLPLAVPLVGQLPLALFLACVGLDSPGAIRKQVPIELEAW